jgi:hypothetical protein
MIDDPPVILAGDVTCGYEEKKSQEKTAAFHVGGLPKPTTLDGLRWAYTADGRGPGGGCPTIGLKQLLDNHLARGDVSGGGFGLSFLLFRGLVYVFRAG